MEIDMTHKSDLSFESPSLHSNYARSIEPVFPGVTRSIQPSALPCLPVKVYKTSVLLFINARISSPHLSSSQICSFHPPCLHWFPLNQNTNNHLRKIGHLFSPDYLHYPMERRVLSLKSPQTLHPFHHDSRPANRHHNRWRDMNLHLDNLLHLMVSVEAWFRSLKSNNSSQYLCMIHRGIYIHSIFVAYTPLDRCP